MKKLQHAALILILLQPTLSFASYCALRDPHKQIFEMFEDATNYSSITHHIDRQVKDSISTELPFSLHNKELGNHTLYIILEEDVPIGLVHARSESSQWGLIEVVWAFDLDMKIKDFRFQRCRDRSCDNIETGAFASFLKGKTAEKLRPFLDANIEDSVNLDEVPGVEGAEPLASALLRSALKTMLVTNQVWASDLALIRN